MYVCVSRIGPTLANQVALQLYAYPAFKEQFGVEQPDGSYVLAGTWQSALGAAGMAGSFFGALLNGIMIKGVGFRWSMIVGMVMMIAFPFLSVFGMSVEIQTVGQALCGYVQLRHCRQDLNADFNKAFRGVSSLSSAPRTPVRSCRWPCDRT